MISEQFSFRRLLMLLAWWRCSFVFSSSSWTATRVSQIHNMKNVAKNILTKLKKKHILLRLLMKPRKFLLIMLTAMSKNSMKMRRSKRDVEHRIIILRQSMLIGMIWSKNILNARKLNPDATIPVKTSIGSILSFLSFKSWILSEPKPSPGLSTFSGFSWLVSSFSIFIPVSWCFLFRSKVFTEELEMKKFKNQFQRGSKWSN